MPKYYCDYCDIVLTHDSPSVRKSHNFGWKHRMHVQNYYSSLPDEKIGEIIGIIATSYAEYLSTMSIYRHSGFGPLETPQLILQSDRMARLGFEMPPMVVVPPGQMGGYPYVPEGMPGPIPGMPMMKPPMLPMMVPGQIPPVGPPMPHPINPVQMPKPPAGTPPP